MTTKHAPTEPKRSRKHGRRSTPAPPNIEPATPRLHGDSYGDVASREEDLGATTATHGSHPDRRIEEPSEPTLGAVERVEGAT